MKTKLIALVLSVIGTFTTFQAVAHHSFAAEFDRDVPVELTGIVIKIDWTNPHGYIFLEVENDAGDYDEWGFEMGSPTALSRRGWTRNSLPVGTEVTISGTRARDGSLKANAQSVLLTETCTRMFAGSSQKDFDENDVVANECED
jgi:hypothetical protein